MTVFTRQDDSPAWGADTVGAETVFEPNPFVGYAVDIGRCVNSAPITAYGMRRVVVRHDEQNVGLFGPEFLSAQTAGNRQRCHSQSYGLHKLASFHRVPPKKIPF
jgi:hypothetical protein